MPLGKRGLRRKVLIQNELKTYKPDFGQIKFLLSSDTSECTKSIQKQKLLLHFIDNVEMNKQLLLRGAIVNATNEYEETPLHTAIILGKPFQIVLDLLKHGAKVNAKTRKGNTALNLAVKKRNKDMKIIKILLEYGADINKRNRERRRHEYLYTPLDNAIGCLKCAKFIISAYLDACVREIGQMKEDELNCDLKLYELVTDNLNRHSLCNRNNSLSVKLAKIDFSIRYPIYYDYILDKLKPFLERAYLLNKLSEIPIYSKCEDIRTDNIILDFDSILNITEYLYNCDLLNFAKAFDYSKVRRKKHSTMSLNT